MRIVTTVADLRREVAGMRAGGGTIGLVPTMGFLHEGHLSLIRASVGRCAATVVSVFVNPTQFGPGEDLATYPRDRDRDEALCRANGTDLIFAPSVDEVYRPGHQTTVVPGELADPLCGRFRPGHFAGVATVVAKLFNMVAPDVAYFGQKDYQQARIIRQMVGDLDMPVEVVTAPTIREPDGLAMSSRNAYLSVDDRVRALGLSRGLSAASAAFARGERDAGRLVELARREMAGVDELQYVELVDAETLAAIASRVERPVALCVAARVGGTRLIDNVVLTPEA